MRKIVTIAPFGSIIENAIEDGSKNHNDLLEESFQDFASMLSEEEKSFTCEITVWPIAFWVSKLLHHIVVLENHIEDGGSFIIIAPEEVSEIQKEILEKMYCEKDETFCLIEQISPQEFKSREEMYTNIEEVISVLNEQRKRGR